MRTLESAIIMPIAEFSKAACHRCSVSGCASLLTRRWGFAVINGREHRSARRIAEGQLANLSRAFRAAAGCEDTARCKQVRRDEQVSKRVHILPPGTGHLRTRPQGLLR